MFRSCDECNAGAFLVLPCAISSPGPLLCLSTSRGILLGKNTPAPQRKEKAPARLQAFGMAHQLLS